MSNWERVVEQRRAFVDGWCTSLVAGTHGVSSSDLDAARTEAQARIKHWGPAPAELTDKEGHVYRWDTEAKCIDWRWPSGTLWNVARSSSTGAPFPTVERLLLWTRLQAEPTLQRQLPDPEAWY